MAANDVTLIVFNHVAEDRVDDFEAFLRSTVVPAVEEQRPEQSGRWHLLRSAGAADGKCCTRCSSKAAVRMTGTSIRWWSRRWAETPPSRRWPSLKE